MDAFQSHSENFSVTMVDDKSSDDVTLNLSIEGLKVMTRAGRVTKKVPLEHITRWSKGADRITMFVRTPVDIEEKPVSFYGSNGTLTSLLDTLTCFALQLVEIMEAREEADAAAEIRAVARNGGRRHQQLKNADEVEFWRNPDKAGWLHSQGDVIKTWRKRWFVLKDGFLFRFLDDKVSSSSKARGVVDLSKVGEVGDGKSITNRPNTIKIGRQRDHVVYLADSETETVEWLSALEATVAKLMRIIAGVDEEEQAPNRGGGGHEARGGSRQSERGSNAAFLKQMESNFRPSSNSRPSQPQDSNHSSNNASNPYTYAGSANYPGIAPAPETPPMYRSHQSASRPPESASGGGGGVYSDNLGVTYGMGTGTSMGGISGIGGVRQTHAQPSGGGALPATLNISDQAFSGGPAPTARAPDSYNWSSYNSNSYQQPSQAPQASALPDTINVTSLIDRPLAQQSSYGLGSQGIPSGYSAPAPPPQAPPAAPPVAWQAHYTPEGQPYYFNPSTGQSSWEMPK